MEVPNITVVSGDPLSAETPLLAITVFSEDVQNLKSVLRKKVFDRYGLDIFTLSGDSFSGKAGQRLVLTPAKAGAPSRVLLVGLGSRREVAVEKVRRAGGCVGQYAKENKILQMSLSLLLLHPSTYEGYEDNSQAYLEGASLGLYEYQHSAKSAPPYSITFVEKKRYLSGEALSETTALVRAKYLARDLGNTPANLLTPSVFAGTAQTLAQSLGFESKVFGRHDMESLEMGLLLGVSQGSVEQPRFFHAWYTPEREASGVDLSPKVVLIGKGVTFDAGGISLKPGLKMDEMKYDMCGGAAVTASMITVAAMKPNCEVHFVVPMTENLPGGNAVKPGDVLTAMDGQTVEVLNTDAEGRLILADALCYVKEHIKPDGPDDVVLTFATLTGAVIVALGHDKTALYCNNNALAEQILATETVTGEGLWRMPFIEEMEEDFKSKFADMANIGKQGVGGSIIGALTLRKFIGEGWNFAYGDIAGTAWGEGRSAIPYHISGATGVMVGTIAAFVKRNFSRE